MAIITGSGEVKGRLGNYVFRKINGRTVACARPQTYKTPMTGEAIKRRNKFKTAASIAQVLIKNKLIKSVWEAANLKGGYAYQKIIKRNYQFIDNLTITSENCITPDSYDSAPFWSIRLNDCSVEVKCYEEFPFRGYESPQIVIYVALLDPQDVSLPLFDFFEVYEVDYQCGNTLVKNFPKSKIELAGRYNRFIAYAACVDMHNKNAWTETLSCEYVRK